MSLLQYLLLWSKEITQEIEDFSAQLAAIKEEPSIEIEPESAQQPNSKEKTQKRSQTTKRNKLDKLKAIFTEKRQTKPEVENLNPSVVERHEDNKSRVVHTPRSFIETSVCE